MCVSTQPHALGIPFMGLRIRNSHAIDSSPCQFLEGHHRRSGFEPSRKTMPIGWVATRDTLPHAKASITFAKLSEVWMASTERQGASTT